MLYYLGLETGEQMSSDVFLAPQHVVSRVAPVERRDLLDPVKVDHVIARVDLLASKLRLDKVRQSLDQIGAESLVPIVEDLVG